MENKKYEIIVPGHLRPDMKNLECRYRDVSNNNKWTWMPAVFTTDSQLTEEDRYKINLLPILENHLTKGSFMPEVRIKR